MKASNKAQIVSFHCVLKDRMGKVISSTFNQDVITDVSNPGPMLRGLAEGLQNLTQGEKRRVFIPAEKAYGFYDPQLVIEVSRSRLPAGIAPKTGEEAVMRSKEGQLRTFRVTRVAGDTITLDANHPLAGQDLEFDIETVEAREATQQELAESSSEPSSSRVLH